MKKLFFITFWKIISVVPLCTGWSGDAFGIEHERILVEETVATMDSLILKDYLSKYDSIEVDTIYLSPEDFDKIMGIIKID